MIDAHCHLNFQAFAKDVEEVIKRARDKKIEIGLKIFTSAKNQYNKLTNKPKIEIFLQKLATLKYFSHFRA